MVVDAINCVRELPRLFVCDFRSDQEVLEVRELDLTQGQADIGDAG